MEVRYFTLNPPGWFNAFSDREAKAKKEYSEAEVVYRLTDGGNYVIMKGLDAVES